jgi:dTDP-4-dehydrorhamnose 3,5-epimerase
MHTDVRSPADDAVRLRYELASTVEPPGDQDAPTVDAHGNLLSTSVEGVRYARVTMHADQRGSLTEVVDFGADFWDEPVVYAYSVAIRPGRIKGWGMHRKQADRYFGCAGSIRVVLFDGRLQSPTHGRFCEFHLGADAPGLLLIPPGVWHADQNVGDDEAILINFPTRPYDRADPDKYRIDPHSGVIPFDWSRRDG